MGKTLTITGINIELVCEARERLFSWGSINWWKTIKTIKLKVFAFFEKGIPTVQWGLGKAPEAGKFSRIFVLKVTLQSWRLLLTVSYKKKLAEQDVLPVPMDLFAVGIQLYGDWFVFLRLSSCSTTQPILRPTIVQEKLLLIWHASMVTSRSVIAM